MTVRELRDSGHDVADIRGTDKQGLSDKELWNMAQKEQRLLITTDKGFALQRLERHNGILIIKLKQPNRLRIHKKIMQAMKLFRADEWPGLTVIMQDMFHSVWKAKKEKD